MSESASPPGVEDLTHAGITARIRRSPGSTGGPWLVMVHGLGESGHCFRGLLARPELAAWNLLLPDLPGYGRSPRSPEPLRLPGFADLLLDWLPAALSHAASADEQHEVVFLGHSMGGVIGQMYCEKIEGQPAATRGFDLRGFVNVEGNLSLGDCGHSAIAAPWDPDDYVARGHLELVASIWRDGIERRSDRSYFVSASLADPRAYHLNSRELVELSEAERLAQRFADLRLPRVFLHGAPDGSARRSLELLAEVGIEALACKPSGHWPFLDQPEQFSRHLGAFLDSLTPRS